ncbi:MAG: hypothetical protein ABI158_13260, partial [Edaphobacter sp.]
LSVAGHLTIFLTRTRGPFWSKRPAKILWMAVLGTQIIATLIAVYGLFMTPLGWKLAGLVWGYAILCFLITDRVKLVGYHFLDRAKADAPSNDVKTAKSKPNAVAGPPKAETKVDGSKPAPKPDTNADEPKREAKAEAKPEANADALQPDAKTAEPQPQATTEVTPEAISNTQNPAVEATSEPRPEG